VTHRSLPSAIGLLVLAIGLLAPPQAEAQGRGRPKAPKAPTTPTGTTPTSSPTPMVTPVPDFLAPVTTFRQFGTWLDDVSAPTRGEGHMSLGVGHWRMSGISQTNVPMLGGAIGITDRIQVSASMPFYQVNVQNATTRGVDDVYLSAKYTLVDPTLTLSEFGLAVSPVVEVLSAGAVEGRVHFALPVSVEVRRLPFRVYGSAGYFTRGSFFTGAAIEWTTPRGLALTGALTQSYSMNDDAALDARAVGRQRVDVSGAAAYPLASAAAGYISVGRSLSSLQEGGTSLALSGGVSFRFSTGKTTP